jgi:ribonuclease P protein component
MPRDRRLKRRRLIRPLFDAAAGPGRLTTGVIQLRWAVAPRTAVGADSPLQVGFAPGRRTSKVLRNRVRRVMRETWRAHQAPLLDLFAGRPAETLTVFALFRGREASAAEEIRRDLPRAMADLAAAAAGRAADPAE